MDLRDAVSYHQLVIASEGRTAATQRQYLFFERQLLHYLESQDISPTLAELNPANVRAALAWYRAQPSVHRSRGGEIAGRVLVDILHLFARFLVHEGILSEDPLRGQPRVKVTRRLRNRRCRACRQIIERHRCSGMATPQTDSPLRVAS